MTPPYVPPPNPLAAVLRERLAELGHVLDEVTCEGLALLVLEEDARLRHASYAAGHARAPWEKT